MAFLCAGLTFVVTFWAVLEVGMRLFVGDRA